MWSLMALDSSRTHKKNYSVYDMDLAAIVFAFKLWRHYLYGEKFKMMAGHKSLSYIFT